MLVANRIVASNYQNGVSINLAAQQRNSRHIIGKLQTAYEFTSFYIEHFNRRFDLAITNTSDQVNQIINPIIHFVFHSLDIFLQQIQFLLGRIDIIFQLLLIKLMIPIYNRLTLEPKTKWTCRSCYSSPTHTINYYF